MAKSLCDEFQDELSSYALGDLEEETCRQFQTHLDECRFCRKELFETREALNLLPMGLPPVLPSPDLRRKLHDKIRDLSSWPQAGVFDIDSLEWEDSDITGVSFHWLRKDETGSTAALIRILPGHVFPDHRHVGSEDCLVLQGGFRDSRGEYDRGDYIHYDAGSIQEDLQALDDQECILFIVNQHGIEFLP